MKFHGAVRFAAALLTSFVLIITGAIEVMAADNSSNIDINKKCSISLTLKDDSERKVPGVQLAIYKVASISKSYSGLKFEYTHDFESCGLDIDINNTNDFDDNLNNYAVHFDCFIAKKSIQPAATALTDESGRVFFNNLPTGLYIIRQTNEVDGYYNISSFLVTLPMLETDSDKGKSWKYDVDASPKVQIKAKEDIDKPETISLSVHKTWNSNGAAIPSYIMVALMKNGNIEDSVQLNDGNGWSYTWKNLDKSNTWGASEIDVPDGYSVSYSENNDTVEIVNEHTPTDPPTIKEPPETPPDVHNPSVAGAIRKIIGGPKPGGQVLGKKRLIQTGQLNWPVPVLATSGIFFLSWGCIIVFKKRKN